MRILHIIHKLQNRGAEIFACQLANHLETMGHEVKILSLYQGNGKLPYNGEIVSLGNSHNRPFILEGYSLKKLAEFITFYKPHIIQANSGDTLKYAVLSKIIFGWKTPIISRNASEVGQYLHSSIQKLANKYFYKQVDRVISVSKASEKDLLKHFPLLKGKTEIITVGLEEKILKAEISLEPKQTQHLIHVGGFSFEKNHIGLLNIFNYVAKQTPRIHLHLIGDGELRSKVQKRVYEMGLNDKITFYGFLDNPLPYIKAADILILPSLIEGLPGVLLEAMYCKTPVVAYNVGGISEIVTPETGILVEKNNEIGFSNAILEVIHNPDMQKINNAYALVTENFMNEKIAAQFSLAYQKTISTTV